MTSTARFIWRAAVVTSFIGLLSGWLWSGTVSSPGGGGAAGANGVGLITNATVGYTTNRPGILSITNGQLLSGTNPPPASGGDYTYVSETLGDNSATQLDIALPAAPWKAVVIEGYARVYSGGFNPTETFTMRVNGDVSGGYGYNLFTWLAAFSRSDSSGDCLPLGNLPKVYGAYLRITLLNLADDYHMIIQAEQTSVANQSKYMMTGYYEGYGPPYTNLNLILTDAFSGDTRLWMWKKN